MNKNYTEKQTKLNLKTKLRSSIFGIAALLSASITGNAQTGAALNFDGVNDFANRPILTSATSSITIEAKVFWNGPSAGNKIIVNNGNTGGNGYGLFIPSNTSNVNWIYGGIAFNSAFVLTPGVWTSIAMVINSNTLTVYKDGVIVVNGVVGSAAVPVGVFSIGSDQTGVGNFNGSIDEVRFWNVVRTQCEITSYLNCEIPTTAPGLLANYHFNQGTAAGANAAITSITDASGNGNNITITNFALTGATSNWVAPGGVISGYSLSSLPTVSVNSTSSVLCSGNSVTLNANGATDLVAYYRLNEGVGTTTQDLSGNNLNGTLVNSPVWSASTATFTGAGNTMTFNTGYINVPDNAVFASLQNNITIEAWIYQTDGADNAIVDRGNYNFLFESRPNGQTGLGFYNQNGLWTYSSGTIPINQWVHVAVSYEGANGTVKFYLNGSLLSTHIRPTPLTFNAGPLNIGRQEPNLCQCNIFTGMIDEVKIWRSIKNQTQIQSSLTSTITPMVFTWGPSSSLNTTTGSSVIATPLSTTAYTATITNASGCTSTAITNISVNITPTIAVNSGAICSGNSFTMIPSGANTYTYSSGSAIVTPTSNASYNVTGTSAAGCISTNTAVSNVTVNTTPTISVNSGVICSGNSFTMIPSGATTYTFSNGNAVASPTSNSSYNVTGSSAAGCVSSNTAICSVTVNTLPTVIAASNASLICTGQTASLTASGAITYTWNTASTNSVISVTPSVTTNYTVTGTDINGCSNVYSITQSVSACTGINKINEAEALLNVFPNPSNGIITIEIPSQTNISIFDALGKLVYSQQLLDGKHVINLNNFNNGLFILKAQNTTSTKTVRLIKE